MKEQFTVPARHAREIAQRTAVFYHQRTVGTEHLLVGLLEAGDGAASVILSEHGVDKARLHGMIDRLVTAGGIGITEPPGMSERARKVLEKSVEIAGSLGMSEAGTEHMLLAVLGDTECVATRLLHTMGLDIRALIADTMEALGRGDQESISRMQSQLFAGGAPEDGLLAKFSRDLTKDAKEGRLDPVIGREAEMNRVIRILSRRTKNNPCLVGEPGVGKTAIVEGLALRIVSGNVPEDMRSRRILALDLSGMVAGTKYRGEFEERIKGVITEAMQDAQAILFIDELHTVVGAGGAEGSMDAANILKPALSRGQLRIIGATTIDAYRNYVEKDAALERRFQPVTVEEPNEEECIRILTGLRPYYEAHHGVTITDEAVEAAVRLSERYISDRCLPDKAIDLMDEAAARVRLADYQPETRRAGEDDAVERIREEKEQAVIRGDFRRAAELQKQQEALEDTRQGMPHRTRQLSVPAEAVAGIVSESTGIPVTRLAEKESRRLLRLENELHQRIIGQDEAVRAVSAAIRRGRTGLRDPNRPIGSFLFLGPTGVGKTELSKALAEAVFGTEKAMIRVDMSEYMEQHSVAKMIGSPPGYVGHEDGGQLAEQVRRHPYSVLLFDEIEKAHPDVFNVLLQVLDEGHITDSHGRRVDFKNTVIIMSSNAGAQRVIEPKRLGFGERSAEADYEAMKSAVMEEVKRIFRPEFINRVDNIIVFRALTKEEIGKIASLLLSQFAKRAQEAMRITMHFTDSARKHIAEAGFSEKYGARPLKRRIQEEIEDPLAEKLLAGEIREGDAVTCRADGKGHIIFRRKEADK